jgi:hypothetical protein
MGNALGIFDDKIQHDINIIRTIRNAFAHSKKLLEFDDTFIIQELLGARLLPKKFKKYLQNENPGNQLAKASFVIICLKLQTALFKKETRAANARPQKPYLRSDPQICREKRSIPEEILSPG